MSEMRYMVTAWLVDKRCNDNCRIKVYNTDSLEDAVAWVGKIKKAWGDSVILYDRTEHRETYIELREDQRA